MCVLYICRQGSLCICGYLRSCSSLYSAFAGGEGREEVEYTYTRPLTTCDADQYRKVTTAPQGKGFIPLRHQRASPRN